MFKQILLLVIGLLVCQFSFSQEQVSATFLADLNETSGEEVACLLKVSADFSPSKVQAIGGVIGSQVGAITTVRLPSGKIAELTGINGVDYCQIANSIQPNLDRAIPDVRADSVYGGYGLQTGYTGKDVIIGVTDWGFDYTHPMFYDTSLKKTRILAAWDQFKTSGPRPKGFDYGTEYEGADELLAAEKDTINIYGYATHGTHVAGIAGGGGAGTVHRGVAYESEFLFATFLADEAAVIDAFVWMKEKAEEYNKRLVINMSWGLYNLGPLDGTSLVSQAIDKLSEEGVIFVTSGGNNGDVNFHIKKTFAEDTLRSRIDFYPFSAHPNMWGQSISIWGEKGQSFEAGFDIYDKSGNLIMKAPLYKTADGSKYVDSMLLIGGDTIRYNIAIERSHPLNDVPHMRLRIQNKSNELKTGLKAFSVNGTVHVYNVVELTTDVGNWGMPLVAWKQDWIGGDNEYSLGEPASTRSVITVAAHQSEIRINGELRGGGFIAPFSSLGPTVDGRMKPDISAPGVNIASSVSSFTNRNYTLLLNTNFNGKNYPFSRFSGTSMSGPAVAGVVALMLQADPQLYAEDAKQLLHSTAREDSQTGDLSENGDARWGWGKVNALGAVKAAEFKFVNVDKPELYPSTKVLFPNPAQQTLYVGFDQMTPIEIYSLEGRRLFSGAASKTEALNVSTLSNGMYLMHFKEERIVPQRFIIQR